MPKGFQILLRICFAFIVIVIGNYVIVAQVNLNGTWTANDNNYNWNNKNKDDKDNDDQNSKDKVYLNFRYQTSKGNDTNQGSSYAYGDLQGLTEAQVAGANSPVKFRIAREAGTIECEGNFQNGKGAGTFRFTSNPQFISAMKTRGFDFEKPSKSGDERDIENRLFAATTINVTTALADDLLSANFGKLDVDDLFKAAIFKVDSKFMREMNATGFPNLNFDDLVKARIFKIDADYVKQVTAMNFKTDNFESLVKMKIFKITPEYIAEVRNAGFPNLDAEDLVKLKIFKIDSAFIQKAKADGVPLDVENLVQRRIGVWHGK
ncbi:MAG: hypothetical protein ACR2N3_17930 [Pyrinomonadaceae bacterium]